MPIGHKYIEQNMYQYKGAPPPRQPYPSFHSQPIPSFYPQPFPSIHTPSTQPVHHTPPPSTERTIRLEEMNKRLSYDLEKHLREDCDELYHKSERLDQISRHIAVLQRIAEELVGSLSAIEGISPPQKLSGEPSVESEYELLLRLIKQLQDRDLKEKIMTGLATYHCKSMIHFSELEALRATLHLKQEQIDALEGRLTQALADNKAIYNQLLEASLLKKQEKQQTQLISSRQKDAFSTNQKRSPREETAATPQKDLYAEIRRCYEEISFLKEELRSAESFERDRISCFQSSKARLELDCLLFQKKFEEREGQVRELKARLKERQSDQNPERFHSYDSEIYQEEIGHLKIKVLALESLQVVHSHNCHFSSEANIEGLVQKLEPLLGGSEKLKKIIRLMAETYAAMKELGLRLEQREGEVERLRRKGKGYKERLLALERRRGQEERELRAGYQAKYNDYNRLIERMQRELQKTLHSDKDNTLQQVVELTASPLQHKLEQTSTQVVFLQKELALRQQLVLRLEAKASQLSDQISRLTRENGELVGSNRQAQRRLLEQDLTQKAERLKVSTHIKTENQVKAEPNLQRGNLQQQITVLSSQLQQQKDLLLKEGNHCQHLSRINCSLQNQVEHLETQIDILRQKSRHVLDVQIDLKHNLRGMDFKQAQLMNCLHGEIVDLKKEVALHHTTQPPQLSELQNEGYKSRVQELEELLRTITIEKEDKSTSLAAAFAENQHLQGQVALLQEEVEMIKGKAGSLKQIQIIQENRGLEMELQQLSAELQKKEQRLKDQQVQLDTLRKQCDCFIEDNLKLELRIKELKVGKDEEDCTDEQQRDRIQKAQDQHAQKVQHLEQKISNLVQDNDVLKNLVQDLRKKVMEGSGRSLEGSTSQLKIELGRARAELERHRLENQQLREQQAHDKENFQQGWQKLVNDLNSISEELESYKRGEQPGRISQPLKGSDAYPSDHISLTPDNFQDGKIVKSEIIDLMGELEIKNQLIYTLKEDLRRAERRNRDKADRETQTEDQSEQNRNYFQQFSQLRDANQKLRQSNFSINQQLRRLQNEYNSIRLQFLSGAGSTQNIHTFGSAPFIEPRPSPPPAPPRLDTLESQSERSSLAPPEDQQEQRGRFARTSHEHSLPMVGSHELASLAPLVESVREGND